jgi:hypothetical protein
MTSMLLAIERDTETVHARSRALRSADAERVSHDPIHDPSATRELSHLCNLLTSRITTLGRIVRAFDHEAAGGEIGSLAELGVRAQTLAILLLLDELYDALEPDAVHVRGLFIGRFGSIEDVVSYVFQALAHANRDWRRYHQEAGDEVAPRALRMSRALNYRLAVRRAQRAMAQLGADRDLAHFLRAGMARADAPEVSRACRMLALVLSVRVMREPDPALLLAAATLDPEYLADLSDRGALVRAPTRIL